MSKPAKAPTVVTYSQRMRLSEIQRTYDIQGERAVAELWGLRGYMGPRPTIASARVTGEGSGFYHDLVAAESIELVLKITLPPPPPPTAAEMREQVKRAVNHADDETLRLVLRALSAAP